MVLYALEALDDALELTREFLTPFDAGKWAKLALVTFFVGASGGNFSGFQGSVGGDLGGDVDGPPPGEVPPVDVGPEFWALAAVVLGIVLLVALAFAAISAIMEFVFVESLSSRTVTLRRYWRRRWRQGLRLVGFRIALGLFVLGGLALVAAPIVIAAVATWVVLLALVVLVPLFLLLATVVGLVNGFTTVFVVPIMIRDDCGVLAGWRRLWPTITSHWKQYLAYAVAGFLLSIFGGFLVATGTGLLAFLVLLPLTIPAGIGFATIAVGVEVLGFAILALTALLFGLLLLVIVAFVQVPVQTYLRYYALLVLGDVEPEYDLIPEQRTAVRETTE